MTPLRAAVDEATDRLAGAGVPTPRVDAVLLAGHVLGLDRGEVERALLLGRELSDDARTRLVDLVDERARRVPLQHLTGVAGFRRLELAVGPGVFVPRPETELLIDLGLAALRGSSQRSAHADRRSHHVRERGPVVVDLCTGSGALALAAADEIPGARVVAVELSEEALAWARHNVERTGLPVEVVQADAGAAPAAVPHLADLLGAVDLVLSNPPYIPDSAVPIDPEVAEHDPQIALYGRSADGLAVPRAVAATAARLLSPDGVLVMEHADTQGETLPEALNATGVWSEVTDHRDLAGKPRALSARRIGASRPG
ncbi:peptide chain release factor N(5)-glutamine methyltransferase [Marihabitans asiaticum]|uniref:Release factor glutamine methyltransferase n=1 Tax=Marihabitans asiaticum TaxID=415218 RepID=A0A560W8C7_9MICO|nr:peptide chain release factor N(5)-glutamine methyltransferase [Marihabitans asiaticum]TWD13892.1 release factor glutamine methyltransferase [Marihabitans asiaticum]